jgi:ribonuclease HI
MNVSMYTDGASRGNPGPGGYGVVLISQGLRKELSKGYRLTTNNRMELMAVIAGLEAMKRNDLDITVYTDSKYVADAVEKGWVFAWAKKGFQGKKNPDLWRRFLLLYRKFSVKFVWLRGHAGHPENEYCDWLATSAADGKELLTDEGYEQGSAREELL